MNRFLKIALAFALCLGTVPSQAFAVQATQMQGSVMDVTTSISAISNTGLEIPAYYDKKTNKYYLFMLASSGKQVSVTYIGEDGEEAKTVLSFEESNEVTLKGTQAGAVTVVFMQSNVPSLSITLNGTTLDEIHADKDVKHAGNSVLIDDPTGANSLTAENVEIKGRGNSSWSEFDKKGYQIKFDKKTSVLGMDKAKKWVLIPNASDDSLLRNKVGLNLAEQLGMEYVMDSRYVDLWIDGDYRGNYLLIEKVEINENRVNLTDEEGALCEWDENFYADEDYWFYNDALGAYFSVKESVNEDEAQMGQLMTSLNNSLTAFANLLFSMPQSDITIEQFSEHIDLESFVQYYLVNEYMLNKENVSTSFFWYKDGNADVWHLGPVWDFDSCMNYYGTSDELYIYQRNVFYKLLQIPSTKAYIQEYYDSHKDAFAELSSYAGDLAQEIEDSANMNYVRWDVLGQDGKAGYVNHDTWEEAATATITWLNERVTGFYLLEIPEEKEPDPEEESYVEMFRLYNPNSGEHFYTSDETERAKLVGLGWKYEGIGWTSPETSQTPVYRLYNPNVGDHHYTTSAAERDSLKKVGWEDEGIGWYSDDNEGVPVYRQYNPNAKVGTHNFTTSLHENDELVKAGWRPEGISWYGVLRSEDE